MTRILKLIDGEIKEVEDDSKTGKYQVMRNAQGERVVVKVSDDHSRDIVAPVFGFPIEGQVYEHLDAKPVFVKNKSQMRDELKSRNLVQK